MHVIRARNVNYALKDGLEWLKVSGLRTDSRNGAVIRSPEPVCTVYENPCERVLFLQKRDANPFFHFLESIWMLAGRNDVQFPASFAKQIEAYSDDGKTLNGAYGYRWRHHFGYDQLPAIIDELRVNPDSRRCVLQMWDGSKSTDLYAAMHGSKDVPCNISVFFEIQAGKLNMTVTNRSNDAIWGAYGANAVHFSVLMEYMAASIGVEVGKYYQISNNFHVYIGRPDVDRLFDGTNVYVPDAAETCYYTSGKFQATPLIQDAVDFNNDMQLFFENWDNKVFASFETINDHDMAELINVYEEPAFSGIAVPMVMAYQAYKQKQYSRAHLICDKWIEDYAWQTACVEWLNRREQNRNQKEANANA